jgi:hypothetical protein
VAAPWWTRWRPSDRHVAHLLAAPLHGPCGHRRLGERERERVERDKVAGPARRDERLSERDYEISLQVAMRCERGRNCNGIELHMSNETLLTELRKIRE